MDKKYTFGIKSRTSDFHNMNGIVYKKYRPLYHDYILLIESISGETLDDLLNELIITFKSTENENIYVDVITMIYEYKSILRETKINNLIDG